IALWDGNEIAKRGGTDDVVSMRKGCPGPANPTVFYSRSALPIGYGIQIVTPRQSREDVQGEPYSRSPIIPDSWEYSDQTEEKEINKRAEEMLAKIVSNTQALNSDMRNQTRKHRKSVERSRGYLAENQKGLPEDESVQQLIAYYSVVDSLAIRFKRYRVRAITALFALIVSAFIWFELH
ncbi:MAG: hypothetical protein GY854_31325, partial [Deltaproteobacteria bacterium]|nr:hypothetical protein [Deltaproteobacteria bacterium]